jgi:hypothetical protein
MPMKIEPQRTIEYQPVSPDDQGNQRVSARKPWAKTAA